MYLEVIAVLHYNIHDGVIHARLESLYFIKVNVLAPSSVYSLLYISSSSFIYFCIHCYCDACVGVKTLHNTIQKKKLLQQMDLNCNNKFKSPLKMSKLFVLLCV